MEHCTDTNTKFSRSSPYSSSSSPPPPSTDPATPHAPHVVMSPCAACKILRRRCADKCVLAPYFPPTDPAKFTIAHRVFGASNIIKFLQELPESQRADAVSSMVYEASARIRDPVYGSAGAICQLQNQVNELQAQLAKARAEVVNMQLQHANLAALICMEMGQTHHHHHHQEAPQDHEQLLLESFHHLSSPPPIYQRNLNLFDDNNNNLNALWEPLWT